MKFLEYIGLGSRQRTEPATTAILLAPIVIALLACRALDMGFVATLSTVIVVSILAGLAYVMVQSLRMRRRGGNAPS